MSAHTPRRIVPWTLALAATCVSPGCGIVTAALVGSSGSAGGGGTTSPTLAVLSVQPRTPAEPEDVVVATFNQDLQAQTVSGSAFSLELVQSQTRIGAQTAVSANTASLTPTARLVLAERYKFVLASSVASTSGQTLGTDFIGTFVVRDGVWSGAQSVPGSQNVVQMIDVAGGTVTALVNDALAPGLPHSVSIQSLDRATGWASPQAAVFTGVHGEILATDGAGNLALLAAIEGATPGDITLRVRTRTAQGGSWSQAVEVLPETPNVCDWQIVMREARVHVFWCDGVSLRTTASVFGQNQWTSPVLLGSQPFGLPAFAAAAGEDGSLVVIWSQKEFAGGGGAEDIFYQRLGPTQVSWGTPLFVHHNAFGEGAARFRMGVTPAGAAVTVWSDRSSVKSNVFQPGSGWSYLGTVSLLDCQDNGTSELDFDVNSNGDAVCVWVCGGAFGLIGDTGFGVLDFAALQWSFGGQLTPTGPNDGVGARIDEFGNAVLTWISSAGPVEELVSRRFIRSSGLKAEAELPVGSSCIDAPRLHVWPDGAALVTVQDCQVGQPAFFEFE